MCVTDMTTRARNRRGEGAKLRDEILAAATRLLEQSGSEEAVTLRAVARGAGISAPSIYAHFADRSEIVEAVVDQAFADFTQAIAAGVGTASDPVERLRGGCAAYLDFADRHRNRYRLLFERRDLIPGRQMTQVQRDSFAILVDAMQSCVDAGRSTSRDAFGDACAMWTALHGYSVLHAVLSGFPWPPEPEMLDRIVYGLGHISP
jgi:AcrR family transcriptional regulator